MESTGVWFNTLLPHLIQIFEAHSRLRTKLATQLLLSTQLAIEFMPQCKEASAAGCLCFETLAL